MAKRKLKKFREVAEMPHVFQNFSFHEPQLKNHLGEPVDMKGRWHEYFGNDNPITLELACGKGEYTVGLARMYPDRNFIGLDIKGNRIWRGGKTVEEENLTNAAFVRTRIELIANFFGKDEVSEIWITFADPFINSNPNRRLTSSWYLEEYRKICKPGTVINLKTDDPTLFNFTKEVIAEQKLEILECDEHIYTHGEVTGPLSIKTHYEGLNISRSNEIKYLKFVL